ncbi:MAG: TfoX/Sxy family protein [Anaerolineae bacterium]|nr:TfoX/Sxy family protein [Anaerolineae bacterium]
MTDQETAQQFADILQDAILEIDPNIHFRWQRMFGGAGYYANGTMFAAWYGHESVALKLSKPDREALLQMPGAQEGSKQYIEVPLTFLDDIPLLAEWVAKSIAYAESKAATKKRR